MSSSAVTPQGIASGISSGPSVISERFTVLAPPEWEAGDLAEYVRRKISEIHGPQPWPAAANQVIRDFMARLGAGDAVRVARAAFEEHGGMWMGAPVGPSRFAESSDGCFARAILASLSG